jgi:hypothetical protein
MKNLLNKLTLCLVISCSLLLAGCGITASSLHNHAGYADLESPYWWQADSKVNLSLGPLAIGTARWAIDSDQDPELDRLLEEVEGVRIRVFNIDKNAQVFIDNFAESQENLRKSGWHNVIRINDNMNDEQSLMFIKSTDDVINGLVVLTISEQQAVLVNLIGNIQPDAFEPIMDTIYDKQSINIH